MSEDAMSRYDELLDAYIDELRQARDEVMAWWNALLAEESPDGDLLAAEQRVRPRWPAGPASHPRVIGVYRKYWLATDRMNETVLAGRQQPASSSGHEQGWGKPDREEKEEGILHPTRLLIENLIPKDPELAEFVDALVFNPIGVNYEGEHA